MPLLHDFQDGKNKNPETDWCVFSGNPWFGISHITLRVCVDLFHTHLDLTHKKH